MKLTVFRSLALSGVALGAASFAQTALAAASPEAEINALVDASQSPAGAIAQARQQSQAGDLLGAAATLESALLQNPDAHDVRLSYVATLCRLDDNQAARLELAKLNGQTLAPSDWENVAQSCGNVQKPDAPTAGSSDGVNGEVSAGLLYESDSFGALGVQFDIPAVAAIRADGLALVSAVKLNGRTASGSGFLYGGLSARTKNDVSGPRSEYQIGEIAFGYGQQSGRGGLAFGAVVRHGRINGSPFVTEFGAQSEHSFGTGEHGRIIVRGEVLRQDYNGSTALFSRDGERFDLSLAWESRPTEDKVITVGFGLEHKSAKTKTEGYSGARLFAGARLPISSNGTYANLSSTYRYSNYKNPLIGAGKIDNRLFNRIAIGTPIGTSGMNIEGAVSHTARGYNNAINLNNYDSFGAELRLIWKFGK